MTIQPQNIRGFVDKKVSSEVAPPSPKNLITFVAVQRAIVLFQSSQGAVSSVMGLLSIIAHAVAGIIAIVFILCISWVLLITLLADKLLGFSFKKSLSLPEAPAKKQEPVNPGEQSESQPEQ